MFKTCEKKTRSPDEVHATRYILKVLLKYALKKHEKKF